MSAWGLEARGWEEGFLCEQRPTTDNASATLVPLAMAQRHWGVCRKTSYRLYVPNLLLFSSAFSLGEIHPPLASLTTGALNFLLSSGTWVLPATTEQLSMNKRNSNSTVLEWTGHTPHPSSSLRAFCVPFSYLVLLLSSTAWFLALSPDKAGLQWCRMN